MRKQAVTYEWECVHLERAVYPVKGRSRWHGIRPWTTLSRPWGSTSLVSLVTSSALTVKDNREEKCAWRHVTTVYYFWMTTKPTTPTVRRTARILGILPDEQLGHVDRFFSNYYDLQSVYFELNWMFILTSNNFARESRYFIHFFTIVAPLRLQTWITIDTVPEKISPRFAKINEIE